MMYKVKYNVYKIHAKFHFEILLIISSIQYFFLACCTTGQRRIRIMFSLTIVDAHHEYRTVSTINGCTVSELLKVFEMCDQDRWWCDKHEALTYKGSHPKCMCKHMYKCWYEVVRCVCVSKKGAFSSTFLRFHSFIHFFFFLSSLVNPLIINLRISSKRPKSQI